MSAVGVSQLRPEDASSRTPSSMFDGGAMIGVGANRMGGGGGAGAISGGGGGGGSDSGAGSLSPAGSPGAGDGAAPGWAQSTRGSRSSMAAGTMQSLTFIPQWYRLDPGPRLEVAGKLRLVTALSAGTAMLLT